MLRWQIVRKDLVEDHLALRSHLELISLKNCGSFMATALLF